MSSKNCIICDVPEWKIYERLMNGKCSKHYMFCSSCKQPSNPLHYDKCQKCCEEQWKDKVSKLDSFQQYDVAKEIARKALEIVLAAEPHMPLEIQNEWQNEITGTIQGLFIDWNGRLGRY